MENRKIIMITGEPYVPEKKEIIPQEVHEYPAQVITGYGWLAQYDDDHVLFPSVRNAYNAMHGFWMENGWLIKALLFHVADKATDAYYRKTTAMLIAYDKAAIKAEQDIMPRAKAKAMKMCRAFDGCIRRLWGKASRAWEWRKELYKTSC